MPKKVSKKLVIETIINNVDEVPDKELALRINLTPEHFCRLKRKYSSEIYQHSKDYARSLSAKMVKNLERNSDKGDTAAAKYLLELSQKAELENLIQEIQSDLDKLKQQQAEKNNLKLVKAA